MHDENEPLITSPDTLREQRLPPGQAQTRKWPVLHYGQVPAVDPATWRLEIGGLIERPWSCNWDEFQALPRIRVRCDIHCVTRWSRLDNLFEGPSVRSVLAKAGPLPEARHALLLSYGDPGQAWSTNVPLAEFMDEDCLFAMTHDGEPISADHGGPVRVVIPKLYFWKSCKWVRRVELRRDDAPGFWEENGYHMHGDPWKEERYGF